MKLKNMKFKKILLVSFFSLFVLWPFSSYAYKVDENISEETNEISEVSEKEKLFSEELDFAKKAVVKFYKNKDLGENNELDSYFSKDVLKLINYKVMYNNYKDKELDIYYSKYNVVVKPVETGKWIKKGNSFSFNLQVITKFHYPQSDVESENSVVLEFTVTKDRDGKLIITRCYQGLYSEVDELKYYNLLSKNADVDKWLSSNFEESKKYIEKSKNDREEDYRQYKSEKGCKDESVERYSSFDRQYITDWARNNFYKRYPSSSSSYVPYYDFSTISDSYDCTNFVSHALLAGGFSMNDYGYSGIQGSNQWYFRNIL